MIYDKNTKELQEQVIERIMEYVGQEFETCRLRNPHITKREAIYIADYIKELKRKIWELQDAYEFERRYGEG